MSCRTCAYLAVTGSHNGLCTRNIEHIEVQKTHYCGDYTAILKTYYLTGEKVTASEDNYMDMIRYWEERVKYYNENQILKKENKALRELYKKDTGKIAKIKSIKRN